MQFVKQKWFYKRFTKKSKNIKLGFNNLYIFPNIFGIYWIITIIVLYILGANLEVNFTIFLSYLMLVIFLISIFLTHFNLHGLELSSTEQNIKFANSQINYEIIIYSKIYRNSLRLKFLNKLNKFKSIENINGYKKISIKSQTKERGIYEPEVIYGESSSPLSLLNCWFYWKPISEIIVAPERKRKKVSLQYSSINQDSIISDYRKMYGDDLKDIKAYEKGEKKSSIYWKLLAKSKKLQTKIYDNKSKKIKILQLNKSLPLEVGLQNLCFEVHDEYIKNNLYGIKINKEINILPNRGYSHYLKSLYLLAAFNK